MGSFLFYKVISNRSVTQLLDRLKEISVKKRPIVLPFSVYFLGKVHDLPFTLSTFNEPSIHIYFYQKQRELYFKIDDYHFNQSNKAIVSYLGLIVIFIGLICLLILVKALWLKIIVLLSTIIAPVMFARIIEFVFETIIPNREERLLRKMEKLLQCKIEKVA